MHFEHSVDNRNFTPLDLEDDDFADADGLLLVVGEKEQVSPEKRGLHASAGKQEYVSASTHAAVSRHTHALSHTT